MKTTLSKHPERCAQRDKKIKTQLAPDMEMAWSEWLAHINKVIKNNVPKRLVNHSRVVQRTQGKNEGPHAC